MRTVAAAASLAGALALTACSGDSGSDDETSTAPSASTTASADSGGTNGGGGGSTAASDGLEGSWLATTDGDAVALVITGTKVGLFATGGDVCSGTAGEKSGAQVIRLRCTDGGKERAEGTVDSVGKSQLEVTWEGDLGTETYTRSEGGRLPSGLPTASLGS
ncbi:hypothetical protein AQJ84_15000 [Streptomyces resistomycificus]|uniref:Membrane protein n=1 Tax=Streptomyces resistomycificus TaxID=67356 RepID=A0A0L8LBQ4_9ACTN|nr:membrane protein [Streptomyces resistomycificus]KUN98417.1 hypothetical protein AQJ84_15000 [Streptomyces resistomycificus]